MCKASATTLRRRRRRRIEAASAAAPDSECASCGVPVSMRAGQWQEARCGNGGPLHCSACWGDYDGALPPDVPRSVPGWWLASHWQ
eukprot:4682063-Prymnesium_polylepis.2